MKEDERGEAYLSAAATKSLSRMFVAVVSQVLLFIKLRASLEQAWKI